MTTMTEADFRAAAAAKGYAEPAEKTWEPGMLNAGHTHEFDLFLLITKGSMSLDVDRPDGAGTVTCGPGDTIEVPGDVRHTEKVGADGVTFLVARR